MVDSKRSISAAFVKNVRHSGKPYGPDKHCDRHGLILRVLPTGSKQWIWRGTVQGKRVDLGLGSWPYVTLAEARQAAFEYRKLSRAGGDPRALRPGRGVPTFAEAVETVIGIHEPGWKDSGKTAKRWRNPSRLRLAPARQQASFRHHCGGRYVRAASDLDYQSRDCQARAPAHWSGDEVGRRARLPAGQSGRRCD